MNTSVIVLTYNGYPLIKKSLTPLSALSHNNSVLIIDSSSTDGTQEYIRSSPFLIKTISSDDFNHGSTRNLAVKLSSDADIVIFLTQDAILTCRDSIKNIVSAFLDPKVAVAYGRQLPHTDANPIATHARLFNYKEESYVSDLNSKQAMGIKTVFNSNSFSAYRTSVFKELGGFPDNTILSEDMYLAAKAVLAGYKVAYVSDAEVRHSHNYTPAEEFKRYFDIGVFHCDEAWIRNTFGGAGGEGKRFIISEFIYLIKKAPLWIPRACLANVLKIIGYKLGQHYKKLPRDWVTKFSMHKRYWKNY